MAKKKNFISHFGHLKKKQNKKRTNQKFYTKIATVESGQKSILEKMLTPQTPIIFASLSEIITFFFKWFGEMASKFFFSSTQNDPVMNERIFFSNNF